MKQSLIKLVDVILRRLEEQPDDRPSENGLRAWLKHEGYNKRDIDAAMKLVRPRFASSRHVESSRPGTIRMLSSEESRKLTPEARDALARLELYDLIAPFERELVLERIDQFEGRVGPEELEYLLSWVVYGTRDFESQHTIYNVLEGETDTLH